jgi:pyruvate/2-oxoglutarate dehydrogenase complex dihydrolipoamide acyltransferase (E2) component
MTEIRMPQWGMNMSEGVVIEWHKKVGDRIAEGEPLAEIEAAKATGTLESPVAGTVKQLVARLDEVILVQGLIAIIE